MQKAREEVAKELRECETPAISCKKLARVASGVGSSCKRFSTYVHDIMIAVQSSRLISAITSLCHWHEKKAANFENIV
jgi:hypothetical protein